VCTLSKVSARSPDLIQTEESSTALTIDRGLNISRHTHDVRHMAHGLRKLRYSESLSPGKITNMLLHANGYRIFVAPQLTTLLHVNTGVFMEFINSAITDKVWQHGTTVDTFRVTFSCQHENPLVDAVTSSPVKSMISKLKTKASAPSLFEIDETIEVEDIDFKVMEQQKDNFYEIWHGERLLQYGIAEYGKTIVTDISYDSIYFDDKKNPGGRIDAAGYQTLELLIFSLGQTPRQSPIKFTPKMIEPDFSVRGIKYGSLRSISYIKFVQGFRICRSEKTNDAFHVFNRIDVVGIDKVVTFLPRGLGSMTEQFGGPLSDDGEVLGCPIFSPVKLALAAKDNANMYKVTDNVFSMESVHNVRQIKKQQTVRQDNFKNITGMESVDLDRPVVKGLNVSEDKTVRKIEIELLRKEIISDSGATELKLLKSCAVYSQVVQHVATRAKAMQMSQFALLPHEIKSHPLCLSVEVVQPAGTSLRAIVMSVIISLS
jgi:hypothetical protein